MEAKQFKSLKYVAQQYPTQSKYINKTETNQKQLPTTFGTDQVLRAFTIQHSVLYKLFVSCFINWSFWRGRFGSLGRAWVGVTAVERLKQDSMY